MFKNYFKIAWRNLWKNRVYSAINIVGLATGMAACIVILLFVFYERSFDNFHHKNLYRLNEVQKFPGMVASQKVGLSMFPMGPTIKQEFPEIKNFTRISWNAKYQMTYEDKRVFLPQTFFVDSTFLDMFDFRLLRGDRATALQKPNSTVLTASAARKLFGPEDPIGRRVTHYGGDTTFFTVTGILADVPENSQLQFDALFSFNTNYKPDWMTWWGGNWLDTYFELAPNTDVAALEKKFPDYLKRHLREDNWKYYELFLLRYKDVHANAADIGLDYLNYQKFDKNYTNIFSAIALIVLLIACINFMNLSTARSAERAKEVGIRKSIGALRVQLGLQFLGETVLLSLLALLLAAGLVLLALPYVNNLSQRRLETVLLDNTWLFVAVVLGTIVVGILSGLYPAAYLSSFQPVKVLKGLSLTGKNKGRLRNILVVGQFASAIFLMIATIFVFRQLNYMQQRDPGFNRDQVVNIELDRVTFRKYDLLKETLSRHASITSVTGAQDELGSHLDQSGIEFKGEGPLRQLTSTRLIVDPDYLRLYKIPLVAGKDFSHDKEANGREYIINEALAKELSKDQPKAELSSLIGKHFGFDSAGYIVGIARDFNFNSLHYKIETMFLFNQKEWGFTTMSVKIAGGRSKEALAFIQSTWSSIFPDRPLSYQFLDDHFTEVYRADAQVSRMVGILAMLAILISCLGLFGLASYSAERRVKEIGIRKVMGASVRHIVGLLSRHFIKLVFIAILIAWPLAWLVLHRWLQDYAYRIDISWWVFVLAGAMALLIALMTVSILAIKAAMANPVESLRVE
ncbi:MAG: ABC transporter permease [Chitinophagaceae bacterium]|nr:ABC transporter permease [Chitinophagaceae bacterium]